MSKQANRPAPDVTPIKLTINGEHRDGYRIRTISHTFEAIELDMAEQWDFLELAGKQIDNEAWVNVAILAAAVISIDGVPIPAGTRTRETLRQVLRKIGEEGLTGLQTAFQDLPEAEGQTALEESAAGN